MTTVFLGAFMLVTTTAAPPADDRRPLREAESANRHYVLQISPGRPGRVGATCEGVLFEQTERGARGRRLWARPLVNDVAPARALIRDDGRFLVTLDEWRRGGARHALVIYGSQGELLRHFLLPDLLAREDWQHVRTERRGLEWLDGAETTFDDPRSHFVVRLRSGREVRVDLKTLQLVRIDGRPVSTSVPPAMLALLEAYQQAGEEGVIAERLAELKKSVDAQASGAAETGAATQPAASQPALAASQPAGDRTAAHTAPPATSRTPEQLPPGESVAATQPARDSSAARTPTTGPRGDTAAATRQPRTSPAGTAAPLDGQAQPGLPGGTGAVARGEPSAEADAPVFGTPSGDEAAMAEPISPGLEPGEIGPMPADHSVDDEAAEPQPAAPLVVPEPDPAQDVDYVGWLNELGQVEGPDADPVYQAAYQQLVSWSGDADLMAAALRGDAEALASPEIAAWLETNAEALALYREAVQIPQRGWHYESTDGSAMGVLLPHLAPMRQLARANVIEGRALAASGQPEVAAQRYLETLAAAPHAAAGITMIENLVGVAVQTTGAEALLDLAADAGAADLDFAWLTAEAEAASRPLRPLEDTVQGERAMFLDSVQRMWERDPATGETHLSGETMQAFLNMISETPRQEDLEHVQKFEQAGYERTVAEGNAYYDGLTDAFALPYPQAVQRTAELEENLATESSNPVLRLLAPALSRVQFVRARGESTRRAAVLVANLQAHHQQYGAYPDTLDAFGDRDFAYDPFSETHFAYRRDGDSFVLYSVGRNGADDGGVHDGKGETNDLVFWPRPAK